MAGEVVAARFAHLWVRLVCLDVHGPLTVLNVSANRGADRHLSPNTALSEK